jgi:hypothetical protein
VEVQKMPNPAHFLIRVTLGLHADRSGNT